ncbi:MAG: septum formation initiator family protein [Myxococcota bacterium]
MSESESTGLSRRRELLWIGPLAALVGAAFALLYDADNGLRAVFGVNAELVRAEARVAKLSAERSELVDRADRLRSDPFEIESVARESLGMLRPGEIVVRLRGDAPQGD